MARVPFASMAGSGSAETDCVIVFLLSLAGFEKLKLGPSQGVNYYETQDLDAKGQCLDQE